jgi:hypothetical protein
VLAIAVVVTSLFIAVGSPAERILYAQNVFALMGGATIIQALWGHRMPIVVGPAAVLLVGIITALASQGDAVNTNKIYTAIMVGGAAITLIALTGALRHLQRIFTPRIVVVILMLIAITLGQTIKNLIFPAAEVARHGFGLWFTILGVPAIALAANKLKGVLKSLVIPISLLVGCIIYYSIYGGFGITPYSSEMAGGVLLPKIEFDGSRVRLADPETRIDLGGIAKGYIGDRMADLLEERGVVSAIINLGGNVICIGAKDNGAEGGAGAFVIGVEAPYSDRSEIVGKINAKDMTLVTSGVYERQIEVDGKTYHHILSTDTGYSVETDLDAVTLTGAKGHSADLDALSTICLIKGHDQARELIENTEGVEAVFILHDGSLDQTSGMKFEPEK